MTKKVTGKDLEKLIEGVLSERKIAWPVSKQIGSSSHFGSLNSEFPGMTKSATKLGFSGKDGLTDFMNLDGEPPDTLDKDDFDIFFKDVIDFDLDAFDAQGSISSSLINKLSNKLRTLLDWTHKSRSDVAKQYALDIINVFIAKYPKTFDSSKNSQKLLDNIKGEAKSANIKLPTYEQIQPNNGTNINLVDFVLPFQNVKGQNKPLPAFLEATDTNTPYTSSNKKATFLQTIVADPSDEYLKSKFGKVYGRSALTGALIIDVIKNPSHYRQRHTSLVQILRKAVDKQLETDPELQNAQILKDISVALKEKMPRGSDDADASLGKDSPIPQFPITSNMAEEGYALKTSNMLIGIFEKSFSGNTVEEK